MDQNSENRGSERRRVAAVFIVAFFICLVVTKTHLTYSGNEASRLAMVESLIERGTFVIDASPFVWTPDKAFVNGHYYCDKPPLLPVLSTGEAWVLKHTLGMSSISHPRIWLYFLTIFSVGLCAAWLAALFFADTGRLWGIENIYPRLMWTVAAWGGTLIFAYCGTYNNHVPSAAFLYAALSKFGCLHRSEEESHYKKTSFLCGLFIALAFAMDFPPGAFFLAVFGIAVVIEALRSGRMRIAWSYAAGAALPIIATLAINFLMVGTLKPLYMIPGAYDYPGSEFQGGGAAGIFSPEHPFQYAFHVLIGYRGIFLYSPILIPAMGGMIWYLRHGERWAKVAAATAGTGFAGALLFYILFTHNFGGWAYGFRYMIPAMPAMVFFLGPRWMESTGVRKSLLLELCAISVFLSAIGNFNPWSVCWEGERKNQNPIVVNVKSPLAANFALLRAIYDPDSAPSSRIAKYMVSRDEAVAAAYMGISFLNRGDPGHAEFMFQRAVTLKPTDPMFGTYLDAARSINQPH